MANHDLEKQPALPSHLRRGRRRGCCCGCLSVLWKIAAALAVAVALAILVFVIVVNPHKMKLHVTRATLKEFNLTAATEGSNVTIHYNLRLNVTVRNPNKKIGFHYEVVESDAYYAGEKFGSSNLLSFYQPPKTTRISEAWYRGVGTAIPLGKDEVERFDEQKRSGIYPLVVKIRFYSSIKLGKMHIGDFRVRVKCGFKVPLRNSTITSSSGGFETKKCHVDFNPFIVIYND